MSSGKSQAVRDVTDSMFDTLGFRSRDQEAEKHVKMDVWSSPGGSITTKRPPKAKMCEPRQTRADREDEGCGGRYVSSGKSQEVWSVTERVFDTTGFR